MAGKNVEACLYCHIQKQNLPYRQETLTGNNVLQPGFPPAAGVNEDLQKAKDIQSQATA